MPWIRKKALTCIIALLAVFAMLTGFSLIGIESLSAAMPIPEKEDALSELAYHFPDQTGEQAILDRMDDSGCSFIRFATHRFFDHFGHTDQAYASLFSRLRFHSAEKTSDNNTSIQIKLRI